MEILFFVAFFGIMFGAPLFNGWRQGQKRHAACKRAAERHNGRFRTVGKNDIVQFSIAGQDLLIETSRHQTVAEVKLPLAALTFEIEQREGLSAVLAQIDAGLEQAGSERPDRVVTVEHDKKFEMMFQVMTYQRPAVRLLLTPTVTKLLRKFLPHATIGCVAGALKVSWDSSPEHADELSAIHDIVAEWLENDIYGHHALSELGGLDFMVKDHVPRAELSHPAPVTVKPEPVDGHLATVARLRDDPDMAMLRMTVDESGVGEPEYELRRLTSQARELLPRVGPGHLIVESRKSDSSVPMATWPGTRYVFPAIVTDVATLHAAVELLGYLPRRSS